MVIIVSLCKLYHLRVLRSEPHWLVYRWPLSGPITKAQGLRSQNGLAMGSCDKAEAFLWEERQAQLLFWVFLPTWKRVQTVNINLIRTGPFYRERMPKINPVTSPSWSFLSLAGKVSHVMTIVMINQLFLRNLKIVPHLSWEQFEALWHSEYSTKLCAL